jgi:hypothetical protein
MSVTSKSKRTNYVTYTLNTRTGNKVTITDDKENQVFTLSIYGGHVPLTDKERIDLATALAINPEKYELRTAGWKSPAVTGDAG